MAMAMASLPEQPASSGLLLSFELGFWVCIGLGKPFFTLAAFDPATFF